MSAASSAETALGSPNVPQETAPALTPGTADAAAELKSAGNPTTIIAPGGKSTVAKKLPIRVKPISGSLSDGKIVGKLSAATGKVIMLGVNTALIPSALENVNSLRASIITPHQSVIISS